MAQQTIDRVLMVGDADRHLSGIVARALPAAVVHQAPSVFDAIAELSREAYELVLVPAAKLHRRGESAVAALKANGRPGRVVLFGESATEPLSRKLCTAGGDDYLITPATIAGLQQALTSRPIPAAPALPAIQSPLREQPPLEHDAERILDASAVADLVFDALLSHPGDALATAIGSINEALPGGATINLHKTLDSAAFPPTGFMHFDADLATSASDEPAAKIRLSVPTDLAPSGQNTVHHIAGLLGKASTLQQRHNRLQKLAFTDDLTNIFNARYFKHFLARMLVEARKHRFPVTLFLFDIDNFKTYNDQFGHGVGDDILKQTAGLMRKCVRDHDLVARISGDEFAVVFWEKDGPRIPRDVGAGVPGRPPNEPQLILERFRKLLATESYTTLGPSGKGNLTISGGLAVFPYDAQDMNTLIEAADKALMFGAKRSGRNSIALVGGTPKPTTETRS